MTVLLTSAGLSIEIQNHLLPLLNKKPQTIKLAFIPTAGDPESNKSYIEEDKNQIKSSGISDIYYVDLKGENAQSLHKKLLPADVIYVTGGNTFYLLDWVKKSGFNKVAKDFINNGVVYIGASAGSYIACPTIEQSTWKHQDTNKVRLKDLSALNLIPFLITAHFEEKYRTTVEKGAKTTKYPVVALSDTQAILVKDGKWKLVGRGKKEFFNGFKENWQ